jgi:hypothetical protein
MGRDASDAPGALRRAGLSDDRIRALADQYIAEDRGDDTSAFVDWARGRGSG